MSGQKQMDAAMLAQGILDWYGGDSSKWCQGGLYADAIGNKVMYPSEAERFCVAGADCMARPDDGYHDDAWNAFDRAVARITGYACAVIFNDSAVSFAEVEAVLKRVAAGEGSLS